MTFTRRDFIATSSAAVVAGTFGRVELFGQQQPQAPVTPVVRELRRGVGIFTGRGGTIGWLVNPAGAIAVDSQFPDTATMAVDELLKRSKTTGIVALINTHHHGDHTAGNGVFKPKTKEIIGHANVPKYMKSTYDQAVARRGQQNPPPTTPAPTEPVVPTRTFTDNLTLEHGDERVHMKHFGPAHTGGDIGIWFERANVAHLGDLMFNRRHPFIDRANGASVANWSKVLRQITTELPGDCTYIFGHAGPKFEVTGTRADVLHHANYLEALLAYVRDQVKAGKTRDQVVASTEVIKGFEEYGPLTQTALGPAFDEVTNA